MQARPFALSLVTVAALAACQAPETPEQMQARIQMESDSARVAIEAKAMAFAQAFNTGQVDAIVAMYAEGATLMPPDMPAATGRENIRAVFEGMMAQMQGATMVFEVQDVTANGPLAVEHSTWTMTVPTPDGGTSEMRGKYLVQWRKVDGEWMMVKDIWNNDAPMPPAPSM